ncbi:MAG: hypothetical protein COB14_09290 [Alphaproteobacteria bacterium]|nr:MAG: hypothetical protein COB14_09290 [Alphaproteobacteria bacterium]
MSVFRHPKTQSERKADQAALCEDSQTGTKISGRIRSGAKGRNLPTERDDKYPAAQQDRSRGKASYSPSRKAKAKYDRSH